MAVLLLAIQQSHAIRPEEIAGQWQGDSGNSYTVDYDGRVVTLTLDTEAGPITFGGRYSYTSENPDSLIAVLGNGSNSDAERRSILAAHVPKKIVEELIRSYNYEIRKEIGVVEGDPDRMYLAHIVDKVNYQTGGATKVVEIIEKFDYRQEGLRRIKDYQIDRIDFLLTETEYEAEGRLQLRRPFRVQVKFSKEPTTKTAWVNLITSTGQSLRIPVHRQEGILVEQGVPEGTYRSPPIWLGPYGTAPNGYGSRALVAATGDQIRAALDNATVEAVAGLAITVQVISVDHVPGASEAIDQQAASGAIKRNVEDVVRDVWSAERIFVQALIARGGDKPPETVYVQARAESEDQVDIPLEYDEPRSKARAVDVYRCEVFAMNEAMGYVASGNWGHPDEESVRFSLEDAFTDVTVHRSLVKYVAARAREGLEYARDGFLYELGVLGEFERLYATNPELFRESAPGEMEARFRKSRIALETKLRIAVDALALMDDPGMRNVRYKYGAQIAIAQAFARLLPLDPSQMENYGEIIFASDRSIPDSVRAAGGLFAAEYIVSVSNIPSTKLSDLEYRALSRAWAKAKDTQSEITVQALKRQFDDAFRWAQIAGVVAFEASPLGSLHMLIRGQDNTGRPAEFWDYVLAGCDLVLLGAGGANLLKAGLEGFDTASDLARAGRAAGDLRAGESAARAAGAAEDLASGQRAGRVGSAIGEAGAAGKRSLIAPDTGRVALPPGSSATPNPAIAEKLRGLKYGKGTADDLARLSPADLQRELGMTPYEFQEFIADTFKAPINDPSVRRYIESGLDRERAAKAFDELGIEATNIEIAASAGRSTEEAILYHGLVKGREPEQVLKAAGLTEEQGRSMMRRAMLEHGAPEAKVDDLMEGFFSGDAAREIAEARANAPKVFEGIPISPEQARQNRVDLLRAMGLEADSKNVDDVLDLQEAAKRAGLLDPSTTGSTTRVGEDTLENLRALREEDRIRAARSADAEDLIDTRRLDSATVPEDLIETQRLPSAGGGPGSVDPPTRRVGPDDPDFHDLPTERIPPDNVPGGTERAGDETLGELGARRQPGGAPDGTQPDPIDVSDAIPPAREPTARMSDEEFSQLGAQRRTGQPPEPDLSTQPTDVAIGTARMADQEVAELAARGRPAPQPATPNALDESTVVTPATRAAEGGTFEPTGVARNAPITSEIEFQRRLSDLGIEPRPQNADRLRYTDYDAITAQSKARGFTEQEAVVFHGLRNNIPKDRMLQVAGVSQDQAPAVLDGMLAKMKIPPEARPSMIERFQGGQPLVEVQGAGIPADLTNVRFSGNRPVPFQNERPFVTPEGGISGIYSSPGAGLPRD